MPKYINLERARFEAERYFKSMDGIKEDLDTLFCMLQTEDVAPVKHGRWEWFEEWSQSTPDQPAECDDCGWRCSECKTALEDMVNGYYDDPYDEPKLNYCPSCGVRMDGDGNDRN